jgi:hypothetical protein
MPAGLGGLDSSTGVCLRILQARSEYVEGGARATGKEEHASSRKEKVLKPGGPNGPG